MGGPGLEPGTCARKGVKGANERARGDTQEHEEPANRLGQQMRLWSEEELG